MDYNRDLVLPSISSVLGLGDSFRKGLLFLINFAWASRVRLPVLIIVGFMAFDIRMQLEINIDVEMRQMHYQHDTDSSSESSEDSGASSDIFSDAEDDEESDSNRPV